MSPTRRACRAGAWLSAGLLLFISLCGAAAMPQLQAERRNEPIRPIPPLAAQDPAKLALGRQLFNDLRLSRDGTVSCASCHPLDHAGVDGRRRSLGVAKAEATINTPTVFNSALNFRQFWDGRAATLEEQIDGPLLSPREMDQQWPVLLSRLGADPSYRARFSAAYSDGLNEHNLRDALAEFERSLLTPGSRFDRYLLGDSAAISTVEKAGYEKFKAYGCIACHQGVNVGGNMFQRMGVMGDYFADRGNITAADLGRFNVTGDPLDRYSFKVPGLRNVAMTAPYFHDGSAATLDQAVGVMAKYQLGRPLPAEDIRQIVAFLGTLTGIYAGAPR